MNGLESHSTETAPLWTYPIQRGLISNWDHLEALWHHLLEVELRVSPQEHPILLSEPPLNPKPTREKHTELLFETFDVPGLFLAVQGVLSMLSLARTESVVVDIGEGVCNVQAAYLAHLLPHTVTQLDVTGGDLTTFFMQLLTAKGHRFTTAPERHQAQHMKESLGRVLPLGDTATDAASYTLPDGQVVSVGSERFECPEALFRPWLVGSRSLGLSECAVRSIVGSEGSLQRDLFGSVVLSGGSTMFLGLAERLQQEMEKMAPPGVVVKVLAPPEREYSAWIGGSILACLQNFTSWTITKQQYLETGPLIVHRKCF